MTPRRDFKRPLMRTLPITAVLVALLVALFLISGAQHTTERSALDDSYVWVLVLALVALLILVWTIAHRLLTLARQVRKGVPGARLSARWVRNFLILSLPPALVVYFFSAWFLTRTIDHWFDVEVERALADSLALGQQFLDARTLEVRNQLLEIAERLQDQSGDSEQLRQSLLGRVRASGPVELSILESDGTLIATANISDLIGLPERPPDFALLQVAQRGEYAAAEPSVDDDLRIRVMTALGPQYPGDSARIVQAIYPLPRNITALTSSIETEYHRYQNVSYLRGSLKQSFLLILSLVLMLTVLIAILVAINAARRMVAPLSRLSQATRDVAAGDFGRDVEAGDRDEIGFLLSSFNEMTRALQDASQSAEHSRAKLQAQGDYLETVLGNLSSGVLTVDAQEHVIKANTACRAILGLPGDLLTGPGDEPRLENLTRWASGLEPFVTAIRQQHERGKNHWQQEIRLQLAQSPVVLLLRGSRLYSGDPTEAPRDHGQLIVFDDVTILNQAQREAAWAEAARRLAHEVKNPLTPIRLAAERLRMKLADKLQPLDRELLDRASNTIVAQVEALRTLVDAFGDYAREPILNRRAIRLDELIREIVALYQQGDVNVCFELDLCAGPPGLAADPGRLRQMLHNLISNAREASSEATTRIRISSRQRDFEDRPWLQLELQDQGPGFPASVLQRPFEPYVTHKPGGSGLGLAICRKIIAEHDGRITLENSARGGALITVLIPLADAHPGTARALV